MADIVERINLTHQMWLKSHMSIGDLSTNDLLALLREAGVEIGRLRVNSEREWPSCGHRSTASCFQCYVNRGAKLTELRLHMETQAEEIELLQLEIERLREALEQIRTLSIQPVNMGYSSLDHENESSEMRRLARKALKDTDG